MLRLLLYFPLFVLVLFSPVLLPNWVRIWSSITSGLVFKLLRLRHCFFIISARVLFSLLLGLFRLRRVLSLSFLLFLMRRKRVGSFRLFLMLQNDFFACILWFFFQRCNFWSLIFMFWLPFFLSRLRRFWFSLLQVLLVLSFLLVLLGWRSSWWLFKRLFHLFFLARAYWCRRPSSFGCLDPLLFLGRFLFNFLLF